MEFKEGDIVCYRSAFLKSVGWCTDVPKNGRIHSIDGDIACVEWCEGNCCSVRLSNLILQSKLHLEPV